MPVTSTTLAYAKTPARIDGSPVKVLALKRTALARVECGPSSARNTAQTMPTGTLMSVASPTITMVPTIAFPKPPPISKPAGGSSNSTSQCRRAPPRMMSM